MSTGETAARVMGAIALIGLLAPAPEAAETAKDADNKTLFAMVPWEQRAPAYEALSKKVWRTDKSALLLKPGKPDDDADAGSGTPFETLYLGGYSPFVSSEAYALHAALLAKSRGQHGFVMIPIVSGALFGARLRTGEHGAPGLPDAFFNDADAVIATLSPVIPSPETLKQRQADKSRAPAVGGQ